MGGSGWWALAWSFLASGGLTVCSPLGGSLMLALISNQFMSFLFPVLYAIPLFDVFGIPFGTSLASTWMWW